MSDKYTILLIDDDPNNLRILKMDLEDRYNIITAVDGVDGWDILVRHKDEIKVIMLDRMMPRMNGLEFMKKIKSEKEYADIPVIMQTASAEKDKVAEGIKSGVYYYLTKPYYKEVMLSIVAAAAEDYAKYSEMRKALREYRPKIHLVKDSNFEIKTLEDAKYLSTFVAQFFPDPERVVFGISEFLINAIEHGNLGVTYEDKTRLNTEGGWKEEVERRLLLKENISKVVSIKYKNSGDKISLTIADCGKGFDWKKYIDITPERATHNHGRGIAISAKTCFDDVKFLGKGNKVVCTVNM